MGEQLFYTAALSFEAARQLTVLPSGHRAGRLHGHSFLAQIRAAVPPGWARFPGAEVDDLREHLEKCVAPLDYRHLNEHLAQPTDENLARWIRSRLDIPRIEHVGLQSTFHEGAALDRTGQAHVWRRYAFQSAHRLPNVPPGHKCGRMHGHGFEVILHATFDTRARGVTADGEHLDARWAPIHADLHHACLNDISGLENPTSELIASWIWTRLKAELPALSWVTVYETMSCGAHYDGRRYRIWKDLSLDSAIRLARAPASDSRRRVHGHSYVLRMHLNAPLDAVRGWTIDFGDVKERFTPIFAQLDHQPLHELPGLEDADAASLLRWIRERASAQLPELDRIDLYQTRGCGAILAWGADDPALPV